jgi:hypothetical protein
MDTAALRVQSIKTKLNGVHVSISVYMHELLLNMLTPPCIEELPKLDCGILCFFKARQSPTVRIVQRDRGVRGSWKAGEIGAFNVLRV